MNAVEDAAGAVEDAAGAVEDIVGDGGCSWWRVGHRGAVEDAADAIRRSWRHGVVWGAVEDVIWVLWRTQLAT